MAPDDLRRHVLAEAMTRAWEGVRVPRGARTLSQVTLEFWLKSAADGEHLRLVRVARFEDGTFHTDLLNRRTTAWTPTSDLEWTGMGGSADYITISERRAAKVAQLWGLEIGPRDGLPA